MPAKRKKRGSLADQIREAAMPSSTPSQALPAIPAMPRMKRLSISVSEGTGKLARGLVFAVAMRDGKIPPLSDVIEEALQLLQADLERQGISIPEGRQDAKLKTGPR